MNPATEHEQTTPTTETTWMALAAGYELAAMALLLPTRELAGAVCGGEYAAACQEVFAALGAAAPASFESLAAYEGADAEGLFHQLRQEYTRLFSQAPEPLITPYAGVRAEHQRGGKGLLFVGAKSMEIERFMRRCGLAKDLAAGQVNDPLDHVGTMCEFLQYLCLVNARAVEPAPGASVEAGDYAAFRAEHFAPYAVWCAAEMRKANANPLYRAVANLLEVLAG